MYINKEHQFLFEETGAKRYLARVNVPKPNAVYPLTYSDRPSADKDHFIYADDPRMLRLTEELAERCNKEFPVDVLPSGFAGPTGVASDFNALRCVSGYAMDPLPIPVFNNAKLVASLGLRDSIREVDAPYLKELIRLFFSNVAPSNLHIRKAASTGFMYFTNNNEYKKLATLKCLKNMDDWLSCMTGDEADLKRAREEYHSVYVYAIQQRQQPERVSQKDGKWDSKRRPVPTEEEARSGNYEGKAFADNTVRDNNGSIIEGHFAMRRRAVFGFSGIPNYVMTAVMGCVREVYLNRFSFTYKTRDDLDKSTKISKYRFTVGSDVKSMDTTVPKWFFEFLYEELHKYWDERLVEVLRRMMGSSYVVPSPWVNTPAEYNPVFGKSPLDPSGFDSCVGLPSGIFINPDIGKLWMTFVYMILYKDSGAITHPSDLEPLLQGRNPEHALMDMSDDAAMLTNSPVVASAFRKASSPYAVLEPETPVVFLGSVFTETAGAKVSVPNPVTYLVNVIAREDDISRVNPSNYAEGIVARFQTYSKTPIFRDMNQIYEEVFRKYFGINPNLMARQIARRQKLSDTDALVRANPHYLHYRVDPKDVSKEVLDEVVATIPASDFYDDIRHLFKVPTVQF